MGASCGIGYFEIEGGWIVRFERSIGNMGQTDSAEVTQFKGVLYSGTGFVLALLLLIFGPPPEWLYVVYFTYVVFAILFFHAICFGLNLWLKRRKYKNRKLLPKYLEYVYAALVSASLAQIFFVAPRVGDYLTFLEGDATTEKTLKEEALVLKQRVCTGVVTPVKVCKHLDIIIKTNDPMLYASDVLWGDKEFERYVEEWTKANPPTFKIGPIELSDPLARSSKLLQAISLSHAKDVYKKSGIDSRKLSAFAWIGLILLPMGIALRLAKTSLDLFGKLDDV
jgi:hypothetical protein